MTKQEFDEGREAALKNAGEFLKTCTDEELEAIWEVATAQISLAAAEKASRMGVKNPKIAIIALDGNEELSDILGTLAHVEGPLVTPALLVGEDNVN